MASSLCDQCAALCCRYFALPLETPTTRRQYDDIRWYLVHENCAVFIEKKTWYLAVMAKCKHLLADNRCGIYETRPRICKEYSTDNCDYHGGEYDYDKLFTSAEQLWDYALEQLKLDRQKRARQRQQLKAKKPAGQRKSQTQVKSTAKRSSGKLPRVSRATFAPATNGSARNGQSGAGNGSVKAGGIRLPVLRRGG